jgi:AraC-like DNA-binding protein
VRRELAERHLREQRLAIGEIGFLLGFSEASVFHRAFKRWTGWRPLAYRDAHAIEAASRPSEELG